MEDNNDIIILIVVSSSGFQLEGGGVGLGSVFFYRNEKNLLNSRTVIATVGRFCGIVHRLARDFKINRSSGGGRIS